MASFKDLINVQFVDLTNHVSTNADDIMGVVFDYHWGPANKLLVLDRAEFDQYFPESLPVGAASVDVVNYFAYAQIRKAFDLGLSKVEIMRLNPTGRWKYGQVNVTAATIDGGSSDHTGISSIDGGSATLVGTTIVDNGAATLFTALSGNQLDDEAPISIGLKYPGVLPKSLISGADRLAVKIRIVDSVVTIKVCSVRGTGVDAEYTTLEEFEGGYVVGQMIEGRSFYLPDVVASSDFIVCAVNDDSIEDLPESVGLFPTLEDYETVPTVDADYIQAISTVLTTVYSDIQQSQCTMLISSVPTSDLDLDIINVCASRMNVNSIIGYPTANVFDKDHILTFQQGLVKDKFEFFICGREMIEVFGLKLLSNCVGGWCGATAKIARDVRLNQPASAITYGAYAGTLEESLAFGDVLTLHNDNGVCSVYKSYTGPQIFGVRSQNTKQNSYFGKMNVMRVCAAILKNVFPQALNAIHTDVAANDVSRTSFEAGLNSIMGFFIANQNLQPDSRAICSKDINTDYLTKGGTELNIILVCHFIGVVEKVNIKVVATDSSVTAEII